MADPVLPLSLELFALRAYVLSFAVFEIIKIIAFISRTIFPLEDSEALHLSLRKSSLILTLFITIFVHKRHEAFSVKFIIFKNTLIDRFIHKLISSFSMFSSIKKFSPVVALLFGPELFSLTTRQRIQPLACISIILFLVHIFACSFCRIVPDLTFVITAIIENISAVSMSESA